MPSPSEVLRGEPYDYSQAKGIAEFRQTVAGSSSDTVLPLITRRAAEAKQITTTFPDAHRQIQEYPKLIPHQVDQGVVLTSNDTYEGMRMEVPPDEYLDAWQREWETNLQLANQTSRIEAMRELEQNGFVPPQSLHGVLDESAARGVMLQLSDLGQNSDLTRRHRMHEEAQKLAKLNQLRKDAPNSIEIRQLDRAVEVFVSSRIAKAQTHRTDLLATGPFSFVGRNVRSYVGLGAMPDVNGSVLALETAAKMHMLSEVPEVGFFSDPKRQAALAQAVLIRLNRNDPLLKDKSEEEKDFVVDHWRSNVVGVLEVNEYKAFDRAEQLAQVGVQSFRVYGHTQGGDVIKTVRSLRQRYPKAEIFASQITNVEDAIACEAVGADAVIIGVGSGGRCTTADRSQLVPSNALLAWHLRGNLGIPVIGEGGAVDEPVISALVGFSGVNGSGSIAGGTFEAPGGMFFLTGDGKNFVKPYGGEASPRTKELSGRIYPTGYPYFSEGDQAFKPLVSLRESMTQTTIDHWEKIVLGGVVLGADAGPYLIQRMQQMDPSPLWEKSATTQYLQRTH